MNMRRRVIIFMFLLLFAILPAASLCNWPEPVYAGDQQDWELKNAQLVFANSESNPVNLSTMKVSIVSGRVSCSFNGPFSTDLKGSKYAGNLRISMDGTYSDSSGMRGTYTYSISGTLSMGDKSIPWNGNCSSSFTGPGGIVDGGTYTVSYSGCTGTLSGPGGSVEASNQGFKIRFTAVALSGENELTLPTVHWNEYCGYIELPENVSSAKIFIAADKGDKNPHERSYIPITLKKGQKINIGEGWAIRVPSSSRILYHEEGYWTDTKTCVRTHYLQSCIFTEKGPGLGKGSPDHQLTVGSIVKDLATGILGYMGQSIMKDIDSALGIPPRETYSPHVMTCPMGTQYIMEITDSNTVVKVLEGKVDVISNTSGRKVTLNAGQRITGDNKDIGQVASFDISTERAKYPEMNHVPPVVVAKQGPNGTVILSPQTLSSQSSSSLLPQDGSKSSGTSGQTGTPTKKKIKIGPLSCFIATAAYGSETAKQLDTLRAFRDKVLIKSEPGKWFVDTYYQVSPPLAEYITEHEEVRVIVREILLDPVVFILDKSQGMWNN